MAKSTHKPDWSKAPHWATSFGKLREDYIWFNEEKFTYIHKNLSSFTYFFLKDTILGFEDVITIALRTEKSNEEKPVQLADSITSTLILKDVLSVQEERAKEYEQDGGERSFDRIAAIFNAYTNKDLFPSDVALLLRILKEVRSEHSDKVHYDSFKDSVSYESLRAELRIKEKKVNEVS